MLKKICHSLCSLSANIISPQQGGRGKRGLNPSSLVLARLSNLVRHHLRPELYIKITNATMRRTLLSVF